jgi:hypothetical protein
MPLRLLLLCVVAGSPAFLTGCMITKEPALRWQDDELTTAAQEINRKAFDGKIKLDVYWFLPAGPEAQTVGLCFDPKERPGKTDRHAVYLNALPPPMGVGGPLGRPLRDSVLAHEMVHAVLPAITSVAAAVGQHGPEFQKARAAAQEKLGYHVNTGHFAPFW